VKDAANWNDKTEKKASAKRWQGDQFSAHYGQNKRRRSASILIALDL